MKSKTLNNQAWFVGTSILTLALFAQFLFDGNSFHRTTPQKRPTRARVTSSVESPREVIYLWKVADQYEIKSGRIQPRLRPLETVELGHELAWISKEPRSERVQISWDIDFQKDVYDLGARDSSVRLNRVRLGDNYWRVKDSTGWKKPRYFRVVPSFLPEQPSVLTYAPARLADGKGQLPLTLSSLKNFKWHLLQVSRNSEFTKSEFHWIEGRNMMLPIPAKGRYYVKFQGVTRNQELSQFSPVYQIDVKSFEKQKPAAPARKKTLARLLD